MSETIQKKNKALVLDAFDTLFNKRDYPAAESYWSPNYIQHSAHIEPGREGLFNLVEAPPDIPAIRTWVHRREGRLRHRPRAFLGTPACRLTWIVARYRQNRKRPSGRTLGCIAGRSHKSANRRAACRCLATTSLPN